LTQPTNVEQPVGEHGGLATAVWVFPSGHASELVAAVKHAEAVGIDQWWVGDEGAAREPFAVLSAASQQTSRIELAVGITNPYTRHPGLTAVSALTIHELSNGRFILGYGAGGSLALEPFELERPQPLAQVERAIRIARAVCSGQSTEGYVAAADAIRIEPGMVPMKVFVGAKGERLNRLASAAADGVVLAGIAPDDLSTVIGWARSVRPISVCVAPSVAFTEGAVEAARPNVVWGLLNAPPQTRERLGLDESQIREAAEALRAGNNRLARRLVTDDVMAGHMVFGSPREVGNRLAEMVLVHTPETIGVAINVDDPAEDPATLIATQELAAEAFVVMRTQLASHAAPGTRSEDRGLPREARDD
jgi:5,10-methylenetetrahydromethanopterin reductase